MKNYYDILEVKDDSTLEEIKKSYRKLAKEYHPDRNPDDLVAEDKFKSLAEAYSVISDADKRRQYDLNKSKIFTGNWAGYDINDIMEDLKGTGFAENFDRHFGSQFGYNNKRGADVNIELTITFDDVYNGCTKYFNYSAVSEAGNTFTDSVNIEIPRGVSTGYNIRVKYKGNYNPYNSELQRGDLLITINVVNRDNKLKRQGDDIHCSVDVDLYTAVLGGDIYITSISNKNKLKIKIPELSRQGQLLRLKHRGFPKYIKGYIWDDSSPDTMYGDMIVNINIAMPDALTDEQRKIFKQLKKINVYGKS